jgi:small basic protein
MLAGGVSVALVAAIDVVIGGVRASSTKVI